MIAKAGLGLLGGGLAGIIVSKPNQIGLYHQPGWPRVLVVKLKKNTILGNKTLHMLVSSGLLQVKILWLTITWRWRSFKLKMSPQATGLNAVPIQMIPWETSVTHNITCGKRGSEQMTYSLLYQLSFRCMSPSEILWRTWDFWVARNNRSNIWLLLLLPHSWLD